MKLPLAIFSAAVLVILQTGTAAGESVTTIRLDQYGVELTLPVRWSMRDTTEEYAPPPEGKERQILFADDDRRRADVGLFVVEAKEDASVDEWAESLIPWYLAKYADRSGYETVRSEQKQVTVSPGTTAGITYYRITLILPIESERSLAFVYFEHAGYYFFMTVYNRLFSPVEWELEKTILPGLRLFEPGAE